MQSRNKRQAVKLTDMRLDQEEQNQEEQKQEEIVKDQDISESINEERLSQQFEEQRITIPSDLVFDRHTPQVIDQDVEQFQSNLDQLLQGFRNSALQQFCSIKKDMLMQQANVIENEKRKCTTTVAIKQDELEHAKEEIARLTSELQSLKIQRNSLALICGTNRSKMRILQLYSKTYRSIYLFSKYTKWKKWSKIQVLKHYQIGVKRKCFKAIFDKLQANKTKKQSATMNSQIQQASDLLSQQYSKEIQTLRQQLEETQAQLNNEVLYKQNMQIGLKKAFMRGVCALNLEAMNILQPQNNGEDIIENELQQFNIMAQNIQPQLNFQNLQTLQQPAVSQEFQQYTSNQIQKQVLEQQYNPSIYSEDSQQDQANYHIESKENK